MQDKNKEILDNQDNMSVDSVEQTQNIIAEEIYALKPQVQPVFIALSEVQKQKDILLKKKEQEIFLLEAKYHNLQLPLLKKINNIVNAKDQQIDQSLVQEHKKKHEKCQPSDEVKVNQEELASNYPKVPHFWYYAMKNNDIIKESIKEQDEPVMKLIQEFWTEMVTKEDFKDKQQKDQKEDVESPKQETNEDQNKNDQTIAEEKEQGDKKVEETKTEQPKYIDGFKLCFKFTSPNEYFSNQILTKTYQFAKDNRHSPVQGKGTKINWHEGKNLTEKTIKKKQKNKKSGKFREIIKTEERQSFFNIFKDHKKMAKKDIEALDDDKADQILGKREQEADVATQLHEILINSPLEYYFGLSMDDDDDDDNLDDDDDFDDLQGDDDQDGSGGGGGDSKKKGGKGDKKKKKKKSDADDLDGGQDGDQGKCKNQ